jgi:hypothetical protein
VPRFGNHEEVARIQFDDDDLEINLKELELREKLDASIFAKP